MRGPKRRVPAPMPEVSILIPAYRPDYFDACVASALAQTWRDFELVVSDDCPGDDIRRILAKWDDPRIRYEANPTPGRLASNVVNLLRLARGRYLKFLWDDDLLLPRSVQMLMQALQQTGAALAFHHRHFIDETGYVTQTPQVVDPGAMVRIPPNIVFTHLLAQRINWIGEPSNVMVRADALRAIERPFEVEGRTVRFMNDVAMFYNLARAGHELVGIGAVGSAFRQHSGQGSNKAEPLFAAGVFEWELMMRSARAAGLLGQADYQRALLLVRDYYRLFGGLHPILGQFQALQAGATPAKALSDEFLETLDRAYFELEVRRLGSPAAPATQAAGAARAAASKPVPALA